VYKYVHNNAHQGRCQKAHPRNKKHLTKSKNPLTATQFKSNILIDWPPSLKLRRADGGIA